MPRAANAEITGIAPIGILRTVNRSGLAPPGETRTVPCKASYEVALADGTDQCAATAVIIPAVMTVTVAAMRFLIARLVVAIVVIVARIVIWVHSAKAFEIVVALVGTGIAVVV